MRHYFDPLPDDHPDVPLDERCCGGCESFGFNAARRFKSRWGDTLTICPCLSQANTDVEAETDASQCNFYCPTRQVIQELKRFLDNQHI